RSELLQKYADADLFALLSEHEAFGICVAEALAAKTSCVLANSSGLTEWIDNKNCFGINFPIDIDELANLINTVIGRRVSGIKLQDWDETSEKIINAYSELLNL
ncbi:MAG: glycosyltransferase, partial [Candidatus Bathyarchaeota archaeon]